MRLSVKKTRNAIDQPGEKELCKFVKRMTYNAQIYFLLGCFSRCKVRDKECSVVSLFIKVYPICTVVKLMKNYGALFCNIGILTLFQE